MADRDSNFANAFETTLTADMGATDLSVTVATTVGGPSSPCYLVIDPEVPAKREYIYFDGTFTGTAFVTSALANRHLSGSAAASGLTHQIGAIVRMSPVKQHFDDLHDRIDAHPAESDPHPNYLPQSAGAGQPLSGSLFFGTGAGVHPSQAAGSYDGNTPQGSLPVGYTYKQVTAEAGWPSASGWVETINDSDIRCFQRFYTVGPGHRAWIRRWNTVSAWQAWTEVTDHGELQGLSDNDHPQYALASGLTAYSKKWLHARAYQSSAVSVTSGTPRRLPMTEETDPDGLLSTVSSGIMVTAPAAGLLRLVVQVAWGGAGSSTGARELLIYDSAGAIIRGGASVTAASASGPVYNAAIERTVVAGEAMYPVVNQTSGAGISLTTGVGMTFLHATFWPDA